MPKDIKARFYLYKYRHVKKLQPCGVGKKIEMLEAIGYKIVAVPPIDHKKEEWENEDQVFAHICYNWNDYPLINSEVNAEAMQSFIKSGTPKGVSTHRKRVIINMAGYKQVFIKK
jgi:hypothetical protein